MPMEACNARIVERRGAPDASATRARRARDRASVRCSVPERTLVRRAAEWHVHTRTDFAAKLHLIFCLLYTSTLTLKAIVKARRHAHDESLSEFYPTNSLVPIVQPHYESSEKANKQPPFSPVRSRTPQYHTVGSAPGLCIESIGYDKRSSLYSESREHYSQIRLGGKTNLVSSRRVLRVWR